MAFSLASLRLLIKVPIDSHYKLRRICVCGNVLSICHDSIPVVSSVAQGSMLGPLVFILYASEMFDMKDNILFEYAYGSTLLAVGELADLL